jgi:Trk K+ transport system NAD-binding subunit
VSEVTVAGGDVVERSLRDAGIRERFGVTVISVTRRHGDVVTHATPDTILHPGDRARVFGLPAQIDAFRSAVAETSTTG